MREGEEITHYILETCSKTEDLEIYVSMTDQKVIFLSAETFYHAVCA